MGTIIVGAVVLGAFGWVAYYMYKQKRAGKSSCSGCSGCSCKDSCHPKAK